jgi:hypothetical protein
MHAAEQGEIAADDTEVGGAATDFSKEEWGEEGGE